MSRCFPFPPPGYEKKARPDGVNLIIKEKHKEKKHKKDKDKKDRSERKEKGRSEDKRREKKERKQKQNGDRKDKEKHKDKYRTSEENQNGEKPGPISELGNTIPNSRAFVELQRGVENDCEATHNQMVGKIIHSDQKSARLPGRVEGTDKRKHARMVNGESLEINAMGSENGRVSIFSGENREKFKGSADHKEKGKTGDGKRDGHKNRKRDKKGKSKDKVGEREKEMEKEKEKVKETSKDLSKQRESNCNLLDVHNKPSDLLKERHGSQGSLEKQEQPELNGFSYNGIPLNKLPRPISFSHQVIQNGISINSSQNTANLAVEKPGGFQNHAVNIKNLPSLSVGNGMKLEHGQTANHFSAEQREATINNVVNNSLVSSHPVSRISKKTEPSQTASKVLKLQQRLVNNHKAQDKVSTSLLNAESGRMEINQPNIHRAQESRGVIIKHKMDNKDSGVNGIIETEQYTPSSTPSASLKVKKTSVKPAQSYSKNLSQILNSKDSQLNGIIDPKQYTSSSTPSASLNVKENTVKPPHPDSKYLSQILTVPNVECPEFEDQGWLFSSEVSRAKRPKIASNQIEGMKVWAEVIPVESADVIALPYVIPY
ncbi:Hypothetical predicted protein [Olea europaea subsp. europaea]|uniref:Myb-like protein X n=1 Tax=Olea europaea subsp. europaea TaxID=158383 RepID=A0A8S0UM30_OLEEU|nr:Hypothetical predicted protein [Olea europaea subsp. europaea]